MVFNATLKNNISVFGGGGKWSTKRKPPNLPQITDKLYHIMLYQVHLTRVIQTHNFSGDRH